MRYSKSIELYIDEIRDNVGTYFQQAVSVYKIPLSDVFNKFIESRIAWGIENQIPKFMVGMCGKEYVKYIFQNIHENYHIDTDYGKEYWIGWALAYLQWCCGMRYVDMCRVVPLERISLMYRAYHEMDDVHLREFADKFLIENSGPWSFGK